MAETEVQEVKAGRELDAKVEAAIFGNPTRQASECCERCWVRTDGEQIPNYSTDIGDAWKVVEWVCETRKWYSLCYRPTGAACNFSGFTQDEVLATFEECGGSREKAQALAICRAALLAAPER